MHIRIQQRNGRKSLTTVQGLKKEYSYNKILKDLKKEFCCNGTVVQDPELGQVGCRPMLCSCLPFSKPNNCCNLIIVVLFSNSDILVCVQVIQLQGDQRKNVSTFLVQVTTYHILDLLGQS